MSSSKTMAYGFSLVAFVLTGCTGSIINNSVQPASQPGSRGSNDGGAVGDGAAPGAGFDAGRAPTDTGIGGGSRDASGAAPESSTPRVDAAAYEPEDAGPRPHITRPCPSAASDIGVWEQVTPPQIPLNSSSIGIVAVAVAGSDPAVVYTSGSAGGTIGGTTAGLFRSSDCGATWAKVNTGVNGAWLDTGFQWNIVVDSYNADVVYVANGYGAPLSLLKSSNGGRDWIDLFPPGSEASRYVDKSFVQGVSMDPANPKHLVVSFHTDCTGPYAPYCLAESFDSGSNWKMMKGPTQGWEEGAGPLIIDANSFLYSSWGGGIFMTQDHGVSWKQVAPDGSGNQLYPGPNGVLYTGSGGHGVLQSKDKGLTWATLPNSPSATAVWGDGVTLFTSFQNTSTGKPYFSAPLNDLSAWKNIDQQVAQGANGFAYDPDHRILYASSWRGGLWRVVTRAAN